MFEDKINKINFTFDTPNKTIYRRFAYIKFKHKQRMQKYFRKLNKNNRHNIYKYKGLNKKRGKNGKFIKNSNLMFIPITKVQNN